MNELFRAGFVVMGVAITMYVTQQEQAVRLEALQKSFETESSELGQIRKDITAIQVNLAKVSSRDCYPASRWDQSLLESK